MTSTAIAITAPGVYDIDAEAYHADPVPGGSLSSSGARKLMPPGCPALFQYERDHPPAPKREFDLGHAAHLMVLGIGPKLVVLEHDDYRTKDAQDERDEAHAAGAVPLLRWEYAKVKEMAAALRKHPLASALLQPGQGAAEKTLVWRDQETGVWRRARPDWLPHPRTGRLIVPDYKTTSQPDPRSALRAIFRYGYHQQGAWYLDGLRALGLADERAAFALIFQGVKPPYLVHVQQLDADSERLGRIRNRRALEIYAECVATGTWPGYGDDATITRPPAWVETQLYEEI
ncbi:PD-(D/E)XK nuclease-like domain-containing protein [Nonomuraea sp. NPDC049421]|uniref:PD-(D/E)XK nuclease-like domain-containing protein n=1 Tax=Nonomuraea sp. NPDC049421 TaxID=3155275 RepID=UPI003419492D